MSDAEQRSIRMIVVDDQPVVRAGFRTILGAQPDITVVGDAGDGLEAIEVARRTTPDVVLMDIRMTRMDGLEATRRLLSSDGGVDGVRVLILTTFDLDEYVLEALRAGASGFLLKDATREELAAAVRVVARGDAVLAPAATRRMLDRFASATPVPTPSTDVLAGLTARERDVHSGIVRGLTNAEIATELGVGPATVKSHVAAVLTKLNLRDRVHAVIHAYEQGVIA